MLMAFVFVLSAIACGGKPSAEPASSTPQQVEEEEKRLADISKAEKAKDEGASKVKNVVSVEEQLVQQDERRHEEGMSKEQTERQKAPKGGNKGGR